MIKRPKLLRAFDGKILRDLVLAETYGGELRPVLAFLLSLLTSLPPQLPSTRTETFSSGDSASTPPPLAPLLARRSSTTTSSRSPLLITSSSL